MEKLTAIKRVLRNVGSPPVSQLESGDRSAERADEILDDVKRDNLLVGWHFNTDVRDLAPDSTNKIKVPQGLLELKFPEGISYREDSDDGFLKLWDIELDEFRSQRVEDYRHIFDIPIWDHLPESFATWMIFEASSEFFLQRNGEKQPVPNWIINGIKTHKSSYINNLAPANLNKATGFRRHGNLGTGATINASGEPVRFG